VPAVCYVGHIRQQRGELGGGMAVGAALSASAIFAPAERAMAKLLQQADAQVR
jgi:hypothetical protein